MKLSSNSFQNGMAILNAVGSSLLSADFWRGVEVEPMSWAQAMRERLRAVVHPAFVVERPRLLLEAAARGFPVVTTAAAGLDAVAGVHTVQPGDAEGLTAALAALAAL